MANAKPAATKILLAKSDLVEGSERVMICQDTLYGPLVAEVDVAVLHSDFDSSLCGIATHRSTIGLMSRL